MITYIMCYYYKQILVAKDIISIEIVSCFSVILNNFNWGFVKTIEFNHQKNCSEIYASGILTYEDKLLYTYYSYIQAMAA